MPESVEQVPSQESADPAPTNQGPADSSALDLPLLDGAGLPDGIPVPVPAGGAVDDSLGSFEGESFVVEYQSAMFDRVAAFYDAWFASQSIGVPPEFAQAGTRLWRPTIGGAAVQIELYPLDPGSQIRLFITWP